MPDVHQDDLMADFMSMSGVFDRAGEAMLPDMAEKLGVPVDLVPRMVQDTSMNYLFGADMATERADTWRRALALGAEHPGDVGPYGRDAAGHITGDTTQSDQMSAIGGLSDPSLRPSMTEPMNSGDDDSAHADLAGLTDEQIGACRRSAASSTCARCSRARRSAATRRSCCGSSTPRAPTS